MKTIDGINQRLPEIQKIITDGAADKTKSTESKGNGFADALSQAIGEVESLQKSADKSVAGLVAGTGEVTTHDAMIALEKADLAFNLMTQIRAKIVRAYEEVMRTQV